MLVRRGGPKGAPGERHWFLFKERDEFANAKKPITEARPLSVATSRDLDEIAAQADRVWGPQGETRRKKVRTTAPLQKAPLQKARLTKAPRKTARVNAAAAKTARKRPAKKASAAEDVVAGVRLSHPDKVLYPEQGYTKRDLAAYYEQVAEWMLPHIVGRPLALVRCPAGCGKPCFFQKHPGEETLKHFAQIDVSLTRQAEYNLSVKDTAGLIELVQMGVLEMHVWGSTARKLERPDRLIFDLDPDPHIDWSEVADATRAVRLVLEELGLATFLKTTGGKGMHIVVPIAARTDWDDAKAFCKSVADFVVRAAPDRFIATMSKAAHRGKVFVDYLRNGRGATAVAPYSTRAARAPP